MIDAQIPPKVVMSDVEPMELSVEFMIAEFNALQNGVNRLEEAKSSRVNFFLIIVAAVVASIPGVASNPNLLVQPNIVLAIASFSLLLLGVSVLNELVHYSGAVVSLYRRANRVRRWFVEYDKSIDLYLAFEPRDDRPRVDLDSAYLGFRGGDVVILTLNSAFFTAFAVAVLYQWYPGSPLPLTIPLGTAAAVSAWFVQKNRLHAMLRRMENDMQRNVRFSPDEMVPVKNDAPENQGL